MSVRLTNYVTQGVLGLQFDCAHAPMRDMQPAKRRGGNSVLSPPPSLAILPPRPGLMELNNNLFLIIVNRCYDRSRKDDTNLPLLSAQRANRSDGRSRTRA